MPTTQEKVLNLIQASSEFGKRAGEALEAKAAAEKRASAVAPRVLDIMLEHGLVAPTQKAAAVRALGDHAQTLQILANAITKLASLNTKTAAVVGLGQGVDPDKVGMDSSSAYATSNYVGQHSGAGVKRASDAAMFERLGIPYHGQ